ncbi:hypothetical protein GCM10020254_62290 [Streptomyces goshikiensis]
MVQLDLDEPAERHVRGEVGDPVAQLDGAGPVLVGALLGQEALARLPYVGELDLQRARGVALDVAVAGLGALVHGAALQDVDEGVRVPGDVGQDVAPGPAGEV